MAVAMENAREMLHVLEDFELVVGEAGAERWKLHIAIATSSSHAMNTAP
jgi:hypothetical protein